MILKGTVLDSRTGGPVPYASIELTDIAGRYLGFGVSADQFGVFNINAPLSEGTFLRITSAGGYSPASVAYRDYVGNTVFYLDPADTVLDPVVITAPPKLPGSEKINPAIVAGAAGLLLLLILNRK